MLIIIMIYYSIYNDMIFYNIQTIRARNYTFILYYIYYEFLIYIIFNMYLIFNKFSPILLFTIVTKYIRTADCITTYILE